MGESAGVGIELRFCLFDNCQYQLIKVFPISWAVPVHFTDFMEIFVVEFIGSDVANIAAIEGGNDQIQAFALRKFLPFFIKHAG